jgi:hypothetical protein
MKQCHQQSSGLHVSLSTQPYERCCEGSAILQGCNLTVISAHTANRVAKPLLSTKKRRYIPFEADQRDGPCPFVKEKIEQDVESLLLLG